MAQIVCIDTGTLRSVCEVNDIVAIHDDDVELTGSGYANFKVVKVMGKTGADIRALVSSKIPEMREEENGTSSWKNASNKWHRIVNNPKYAITAKDFTNNDILKLGKLTTPVNEIEVILDKMLEKMHLNPLNCTIEVIT